MTQFKHGVEEHVTKATKIFSPLGQFGTCKECKASISPVFEMKEGVVIPKDSVTSASLTVKTHTLKIICGLAALSGSWEEMPPLPFLSLINPVFNGNGLPFIILMESVYINPPGDYTFEMLEGSNMYHEFPLVVAGNTYLGGARINKQNPQAAFI